MRKIDVEYNPLRIGLSSMVGCCYSHFLRWWMNSTKTRIWNSLGINRHSSKKQTTPSSSFSNMTIHTLYANPLCTENYRPTHVISYLLVSPHRIIIWLTTSKLVQLDVCLNFYVFCLTSQKWNVQALQFSRPPHSQCNQ